MNEIILIPAYNRIEFLTLCLENLLNADGKKPPILVCVDNHQGAPPSIEVVEFLEQLKQVPAYQLEYVILQPHNYAGLSHAIMSGMNLALHHQSRPDFVYYIEDDVMVGKDFFEWHRAVRDLGKWFVQVACKNHCTETKRKNSKDPNLLYTTDFDYTALGAGFHRDSICHILQHSTSVYWKNTGAYVQKMFPKSVIPTMYSEQAGLIRRVMEAEPRFKSVWPYLPRGFHAGFDGKNCKGKAIPGKTSRDRIDYLRGILQNKKKMNDLAITHKFIDPISLDAKPWTELKVDKHYGT